MRQEGPQEEDDEAPPSPGESPPPREVMLSWGAEGDRDDDEEEDLTRGQKWEKPQAPPPKEDAKSKKRKEPPRPKNGEMVRFVSSGSATSEDEGPVWVEQRPEDIQKLLKAGGVKQQPTLARFRSSDMEEAEKKAQRMKSMDKPKPGEIARFVSLESGGWIPTGPVWIEERPEDIEKLLKSGGMKAQPTIARFMSAEIPDAAEMDRRILVQAKRQREEGRERDEGGASTELAQPKNMMMSGRGAPDAREGGSDSDSLEEGGEGGPYALSGAADDRFRAMQQAEYVVRMSMLGVGKKLVDRMHG